MHGWADKRPLWLLSMLILVFVGACWADLKSGETAYARGDYKQALQVFRSAAEAGNAKAQYNLSFMYRNGQGVAPDHTEAAKWFRKLAEQGRASAQYNLAVMLRNGQGVPQDDAEAVKWLYRSAVQGCAAAQAMLGVMYIEGRGVAQDYVRGYMWLNVAVAMGHKKARQARDDIETIMTPEQMIAGYRLARAWAATYK